MLHHDKLPRSRRIIKARPVAVASECDPELYRKGHPMNEDIARPELSSSIDASDDRDGVAPLSIRRWASAADIAAVIFKVKPRCRASTSEDNAALTYGRTVTVVPVTVVTGWHLESQTLHHVRR